MCKKFGSIEEAKIYYHPKTQRHLGIGTVIFRSSRCAKLCADALNHTSKMGNIMNVQLDFMGKLRLQLLAEQMADLLPVDANAHHMSSFSSFSGHSGASTSLQVAGLPYSGRISHEQPSLTHSLRHRKTKLTEPGCADLPQSHCMTAFNSHLYGGPADRTVESQLCPPNDSKLSATQATDHTLLNSDTSSYEAMQNLRNPSPTPLRSSPECALPLSYPESSVKTMGDCAKALSNTESLHSEESLESRIQKLLKLNSLTPDVRTENQFSSDLNTSKHAADNTEVDPLRQPVPSASATPHLHSESYTQQHINSCDQTGSHSCLPPHPQDQAQGLINLRTLLPTPDPSLDLQDTEELKHFATANARAPLLKTPSKPPDFREVAMLTRGVLKLFINELEEIMQRDVNRRIVEGHAFKIFSAWWDSHENNKHTDCPQPKSENLHNFKAEVSDSSVLCNTVIITSTVPSTATNISCTTPVTSSSFMTSVTNSVTVNSLLPSAFSVFGLGMFSGIHSTLPKIRRKPKPPSPTYPDNLPTGERSTKCIRIKHEDNEFGRSDQRVPDSSPVRRRVKHRRSKTIIYEDSTSSDNEQPNAFENRASWHRRKKPDKEEKASETRHDPQPTFVKRERERVHSRSSSPAIPKLEDSNSPCEIKKLDHLSDSSRRSVSYSHNSSLSDSSNVSEEVTAQTAKSRKTKETLRVEDVFAGSSDSEPLTRQLNHKDDISSQESTEPQNDESEAERFVKRSPSSSLASSASQQEDKEADKVELEPQLPPSSDNSLEPKKNAVWSIKPKESDSSSLSSLDQVSSESFTDLAQSVIEEIWGSVADSPV
ncbi:unnamed protein product [Calicophoron daubneyi]|uniref:RRM domain-containing protein n=1 Tax=Calicophoron daubneyi TaxID=300641 RepID=A0AAV2TSS4_CALDB